MVNIIVEGNRLGKFTSKRHNQGYSVWRVTKMGTIKVLKTNQTLRDIERLKLKHLITEAELEINIYKKYRGFIK